MAWDYREFDGNVSRFFTPVVKWLVYICVAVFLVEILVAPFIGPRFMFDVFGASAYRVVRNFWLWQLVTYMFVHGGFMHLLFNLFTLWMFGSRLEDRWGSERFLRFVIVVGMGAVLTHILASLTKGSLMMAPIVGISGVVYGILLVYAIYWPDDLIYFYGIFPMKVKYWVLFLGLMTLLASTDAGSPVAHLTHLGGLLFGYLFIRFPGIFDRLPLPWRTRPGRRRPYRPDRWRDL